MSYNYLYKFIFFKCQGCYTFGKSIDNANTKAMLIQNYFSDL